MAAVRLQKSGKPHDLGGHDGFQLAKLDKSCR